MDSSATPKAATTTSTNSSGADLLWNPEASTKSILVDFSRFFIGEEMADDFANGLFALEQNWRGPLASNRQVPVTLEQFQDMETARDAAAELSIGDFSRRSIAPTTTPMYRAVCSAKIGRRRWRWRRWQKAKRNYPLTSIGSLKAMEEAQSILDADLRTRRCARVSRAGV